MSLEISQPHEQAKFHQRILNLEETASLTLLLFFSFLINGKNENKKG
jgi:hypothetical protein